MNKIEILKETVLQVRRDILRMVHKVNSGHPGGSLGCTEFFVVLYNEIMSINPKFDMDGINEDLFFLSNGLVLRKTETDDVSKFSALIRSTALRENIATAC